jgi:hypothetical protein
MASPEIWLDVLAWTKALFDATKSSIDLYVSYAKYRQDAATISESRRVSAAYSSYSEGELESLLRRLHGCRDRFIEQGGGKDRARCICSVLQEAKEGNGGTLPIVDDWQIIYSQLGCGSG